MTAKGSKRLDRIVAGWKQAVDNGRFAATRYFCSPAAQPYVERSLERVGASPQVQLKTLPEQCWSATGIESVG